MGAPYIFLVLYVDDILLIRNDVEMLQSWLSTHFSMNDLGETSHILVIGTYRDRSEKLIGLSQFMYIDIVLKWFCMQESKKWFLSVSHRVSLSKFMCPSTMDER